MNINWFPGHMAKTRRQIKEDLKLVDVVIELLDARIPKSSRNPEINALLGEKPLVVAMNKTDLASEKLNQEWKNWYFKQGVPCIFIDSIKGTGFKEVKEAVSKIVAPKHEREKNKGLLASTTRTMVVGIPNVGKSSFINKFSGRSITATGDRPGVTKSRQWVRVGNGIELLDTPGVLWPKFEDEQVGLKLACTGAIKDDIMDMYEIAVCFLDMLSQVDGHKLTERYKIDVLPEDKGTDLLLKIAKKRGCIISGGQPDYERASVMILDEFRAGKLGRLTLERPDQA